MAKLWYLASPYSKYPQGVDRAFIKISQQAAVLLNGGVYTFAPISHTHPIALYGNLDEYSYDLMLPWDKLFIDRCDGMIICMMEGYETSHGINWEKAEFEKQGKPIVYMTPGKVPFELTQDGKYADVNF